jgi:enoyl-CoA hydratase/carnithine racemase
MTQSKNINESNIFFNTKSIADVVILKFTDNIFDTTTDLNKRDVILHYLERVSRSEAIKTLIIDSSAVACGDKEYFDFFLKSNSEHSLPFFGKQDCFAGNYRIAKYCNIINQVILKVAGLNKFVIHVSKGRVIPVLLGMSLACDYRIVADNTVFQNTYLDLGIMPKGGSPFFLSKLLGRSKSYEILLLKKELTAYEALKYGIVDQVIPVAHLDKVALETAQRFGKNQACSISGIKKLVSWSVRDLEDYLEYENRQIGTIIRSAEFAGRIKTIKKEKKISDVDHCLLQ